MFDLQGTYLERLAGITSAPIYLVGGTIRDLLIGTQNIKDVDLLMPSASEHVARQFADAIGGGYHKIVPEFLKVRNPEDNIDRGLGIYRLWGMAYRPELVGVDREFRKKGDYTHVTWLWDGRPLKPEVMAVARGAWRDKAPPRIFGGGQATAALEAALWALERGTTLRETVLAAVNLGGDADSTGAIAGQLAGACHGVQGVPAAWRAAIAQRERIEALADALIAQALVRRPGA